jgi:hypothetical protein
MYFGVRISSLNNRAKNIPPKYKNPPSPIYVVVKVDLVVEVAVNDIIEIYFVIIDPIRSY